MKLYKVILGLMLICLAFTAKTSNQTHLSVKNIHQILSKSSLSSGLISLVQMYTQNNSRQEEQDLERLHDAFNLLRASLQEKIDAENTKFETELSAHNTEVERLNDIINTLTASVANYEYQLDGLENTLEAQELEKSNLQSQLSTFQEQQQTASDYLVSIQESYDATVADYGEAIELLQQAIESLEQSQLNRANLAAFVQTNQINFQNYALLIEKRIEKVQSKKQFFLKPIAQLFVDLQNYQEGDVPADRIDAAIQALQELVNHLQVALVQITANFQEEFTNTEALIGELGSTIQLLINEQIPEQQTEIENTEFNIEELNGVVAPIRSDLRLAEGELEEENSSWDLRVEMHNILIPKLEGELQVVIGAQNLIGGGSEPEPVEEVIHIEEPEIVGGPESIPDFQPEQPEIVGGPDSLPEIVEIEEPEIVGGPDSLPDFEPVEIEIVGGPDSLPEIVEIEEPQIVGGPDSLPDFEPELVEAEIVGGPDSLPEVVELEEPQQLQQPGELEEQVGATLLASPGADSVKSDLKNLLIRH